MAVSFAFGISCGCVRVYRTGLDYLTVTDSGGLPPTDIQVISLVIDGVTYLIQNIFANETALLAYLNGSFRTTNNLLGTFSVQGGQIVYLNYEGFTQSEIMAVFKTYVRVIQVGLPDEIVDNPVPVLAANGITVASLVAGITDVDVLMVFLGSQYSPPVDSSEETALFNINVYLLVQQKPA